MKTLSDYKCVIIPLRDVRLNGRLRIAEDQKGLVIFSHGSGSGRLSARNNYVAEYLLDYGFSSLLFDLLTEEEDRIYENRFDTKLLTKRLVDTTKWMLTYEAISEVPMGYFGASTGAASALGAAEQLGDTIKAVVSRGGRPDLAMSVLPEVKAPTLLIVGGNDEIVIQLNKKAYNLLGGIKKMEIVKGATHLFEEYGKLEEVALLSSNWFKIYLK